MKKIPLRFGMDKIKKLEQAIEALESQRDVLGDDVVDSALDSMREKLGTLREEQPVEQIKLVTALFADLVGFTAMSERMDPEDMREILNTYLSRWAGCIEEHGGVVEKFIGDAVMAVYGLKVAHEDDPNRAISTALQMLDELDRLNQGFERDYRIRLSMRVGIHTGTVVVSTLGERKGQDFVVVGDTVNLTSRLQSAAPQDGILISHDTYRHVEGWFELLPQEPVQVKGKAHPVRVYMVVGEKRGRSDGIEGVHTPFVGRELELGQLQGTFLEAVRGSKTHIVTITGDPGVGKTRLLVEFEAWVKSQSMQVLQFKAAANQQTTETPFWTLRQAFAHHYQILESDSHETTRQKLESNLPVNFEIDGLMKTHFIATLLGFDFSNSPYLQGIRNDPNQLRERALFYLTQYFTAMGKKAAVLMICDDIQWADAPTLEILHTLANDCPDLSFVIVCLARLRLFDIYPQWQNQQSSASYISTWLNLTPLNKEDSSRLLKEILRRAESVPEILARLVMDAVEGNPFYLEEMVKMLIDDGVILPEKAGGTWEIDAKRLESLRVPSTLTAVLQARLDSLPSAERVILQQASAVGRTFWDKLLQNLQDASDLPNFQLQSLVRREMIHLQPQSTFTQFNEYAFNHAILQEVVYATLLKKMRHEYHWKIATWLVETVQKRERSREFAAIIAQHYAQADKSLDAARWYLHAGRHARSQGALVEARQFLDRAIELLPQDERQLLWDAVLERDQILGELGDIKARQAGVSTLMGLAEEFGDDEHMALAYQQLASTHGYAGDYRKALEALEAALETGQRCGNQQVEAFVYSYQISCLTTMGEGDLAGELVEKALSSAEALGDEIELAATLNNLSVYYLTIGDLACAVSSLERQVEICHRVGNSVLEALGRGNLGYSFFRIGQYQKAIDALENSFHLAIATGARRVGAYAQLNLGLAYQRADDLRSARLMLEQATPEFEIFGDAFGQAAGLSYQAQVLERSGDLDLAIKMYRSARDLFMKKGSPGYAADAKSGLARCFLKKDHVQEAGQHAREVWEVLSVQGAQALEFPFEAYLTCADVFHRLGENDIARAAIREGYNELIERAEKISNPEWQISYLKNVSEHNLMVESWHRLSDQPI